jgi:fluoride exporter
MEAALLVGLGSAVGGLFRRLLAGIEGSLAILDVDLRWSTVIINTIGSFAIGVLAACPVGVVSEPERLFFGAGVCGGFTALSSFSMETMTLIRQGGGGLALLNVVASVTAGLLAVAAGYGLGRALFPG